MPIFLQKHKSGYVRGPFADLQGEERHHLRSILTVSDVKQSPIIRAFIKDQQNAHKRAERILILPAA